MAKKTFRIDNVINRSQTMNLNKALPEGVRFSKVYSEYLVTDASGAKHPVGLFTEFDVGNGIVTDVRPIG